MPQAAMERVKSCAPAAWSAARHCARGCTTPRLVHEAQGDFLSAHPAETAAIPLKAVPHKGKRIGVRTAGKPLALERS